MKIWALADLHLPFGAPEKNMEVFGPNWENYTERLQSHWLSLVEQEDIVLVPGDISWALKTQDAEKDLLWIDHLPGKKILLKGNHDHWWTSKAKVENILPPSCAIIQNSSVVVDDIAICGSRLWDTKEYHFTNYITFRKAACVKEKVVDEAHDEEIFVKELNRLELSLQSVPDHIKTRIAMTHYPPIGADLASSRASKLLEQYGVSICVFGHLHNVHKAALPFGEKNGVRYVFAAADYRDFSPVLLLSI